MVKAEIVRPSGSWSTEYEAIEERLAKALGALALRVDHIGSTSIEGLPSKDIIDVQVTIASLDDPRLAEALFASGFRVRVVEAGRPARDAELADLTVVLQSAGAWSQFDHVPRGAEPDEAERWRKLYVREPSGERQAHVHVRMAGFPNQRYALLFRDYLRAHPDAAASYGDFKRRLSALRIETIVYSEIKDPVCDLIMVSAERWARETGWTPD